MGLYRPKVLNTYTERLMQKQNGLPIYKDSNHHICHCEEKDALFSQVFDFLMEGTSG